MADCCTLSQSTGGKVNFILEAEHNNEDRIYLLLGSISGTHPGTQLPGGAVTLPINWDIFTDIIAILHYPRSVVFTGFYGWLQAYGRATASFNTNGPFHGGLGLKMSFAYPLKGPPYPWDFASNPVSIEIVP